jgi:hypothetical protein
MVFDRNENAAFSEKILDIPKAHTETVIDPHGTADDFGWESVSVIAGSGGLHGEFVSRLPKLTIPHGKLSPLIRNA